MPFLDRVSVGIAFASELNHQPTDFSDEAEILKVLDYKPAPRDSHPSQANLFDGDKIG
jgi:hypothetical protein